MIVKRLESRDAWLDKAYPDGVLYWEYSLEEYMNQEGSTR